MDDPERLEDGPPPSAFDGLFRVYETRREDGRLLYFGQPETDAEDVVGELWPRFREAGYQLHHHERLGEHVLVAEPAEGGSDGGLPVTNIVLFLLTVVSTLFVGAVGWYFVSPAAIAENPLAVLRAWPFTVAVLGVLGVHELGHYAMSRYHGVEATLPYFIPVPTIFGTMGAVIRMKGRMPDRRALFDIGVAGPLAGLAATVVVTAVGLSLDPITVPQDVLANSESGIVLANPPLLELIAAAVGAPLSYGEARTVNPVVIGGWVGMFVTFLNLIPVGQLDGGHMLRAMLGRTQDRVDGFVPLALFGLAAYLYYLVPDVGFQDSVLLWTVWGGFAALLAFNGSATPVSESSLGWRRQLVGLVTFALGLLCFTPVPFQIIGA